MPWLCLVDTTLPLHAITIHIAEWLMNQIQINVIQLQSFQEFSKAFRVLHSHCSESKVL